ncbi:hypothetical protein V8E36_005212 [Tilletia maclaganii]
MQDFYRCCKTSRCVYVKDAILTGETCLLHLCADRSHSTLSFLPLPSSTITATVPRFVRHEPADKLRCSPLVQALLNAQQPLVDGIKELRSVVLSLKLEMETTRSARAKDVTPAQGLPPIAAPSPAMNGSQRTGQHLPILSIDEAVSELPLNFSDRQLQSWKYELFLWLHDFPSAREHLFMHGHQGHPTPGALSNNSHRYDRDLDAQLGRRVATTLNGALLLDPSKSTDGNMSWPASELYRLVHSYATNKMVRETQEALLPNLSIDKVVGPLDLDFSEKDFGRWKAELEMWLCGNPLAREHLLMEDGDDETDDDEADGGETADDGTKNAIANEDDGTGRLSFNSARYNKDLNRQLGRRLLASLDPDLLIAMFSNNTDAEAVWFGSGIYYTVRRYMAKRSPGTVEDGSSADDDDGFDEY